MIALSCACVGAQPVALAESSASSSALPDFLPEYYAPTLSIDGWKLLYQDHQVRDGDDLYRYESPRQNITLILARRPCSGGACEAMFQNVFKGANELATKNSGAFITIAPTEFSAAWNVGGASSVGYAFRLPNSLISWTYTTTEKGLIPSDYFEKLRLLVDRQRYEQISDADTVEMGRWDASLRQLADQLLKDGRKSDALNVLKAIVTATPTDYEAQMEFAGLVPDAAAARESAKAVFDNAENPELISKSAAVLKQSDPASQKLPYLEKGAQGLQVFFIALPPCDVGILTEAARTFTDITKIPSKVVQLKESWQFDEPDRIPNQRQIQGFIAQRDPAANDFKDWSLNRYKEELVRIAAASDAMTRFNVNSLISGLNAETAQYSAGPYLEKLSRVLAAYRSTDRRTLFVGVTSRNISIENANYVFGAGVEVPDGYTNLVSYHMMEAKYSGAPYESRKRLIERLAKQLVPPTMGALSIPRPADPSDPGSYADGIDRLDQKSLTLSAPTQAAIDKIR